MNRQERIEWLTTVSNDDVLRHIIGMSFAEKRQHWIDWDMSTCLFRTRADFREWLFDRVEQKILAERDASYHDAQEYMP